MLLGGLLEAWRSGLGVWDVVGGGLVRVCLGLGAGPVRVPVPVPRGLDLGPLMWGWCLGVCWRHGGRDWGCGTL